MTDGRCRWFYTGSRGLDPYTVQCEKHEAHDGPHQRTWDEQSTSVLRWNDSDRRASRASLDTPKGAAP